MSTDTLAGAARTVAVILAVTALPLFAFGVLGLFGEGDRARGFVSLCLGAASLALTVALIQAVTRPAGRVWTLIGVGIGVECLLLLWYPGALGGLR